MGDAGARDDFRSGPTWPSIGGPVRAPGPASVEGARHEARPPGRGRQAENADGTPPAEVIIASNARETSALKSDSIR